jgi:hypothetical protein
MQYYSKQTVWTLFLLCAFPLHLWALLISFGDISWLSERTNLWDAIGVFSYGLIFAMVETLVAFFVCLCAGFLVSPKWDQGRRVTLLSMLFLMLGLYAMLSQLYFIWNWSFPSVFLNFVASSGHPVRILYLCSLIVTAPLVIILTYTILHSEKVYRVAVDLMDRLSLLAMIYMMLDVFALIVVVVRNI